MPAAIANGYPCERSAFHKGVRAAIALSAPTAQPTGQAEGETHLRWCEHCGEGVTTFCRGKNAAATCPMFRAAVEPSQPAPAAPSAQVAGAMGNIAQVLCGLLDEEEWAEMEQKIATVCTALQMPAAIEASTKGVAPT